MQIKQFGKNLLLGFQHVFASFSATVLVGLLTGLSVSNVLICAGVATLFFHLVTKGKVPVFLGSSFAFLSGYALVAPLIDGKPNIEQLPYSLGATICVGIVYILAAGIIKLIGVDKFLKLFPPVVRGSVVILIGISLAGSAVSMISTNWILAIITFSILCLFSIKGKGILKTSSILVAILVSYGISAIFGWVDFSGIGGSIIGMPSFMLPKFEISSIIVFGIISLSTIAEHISDISSVGVVCGEDYLKYLPKTLIGDGIGTSIGGLFSGCCNTTYGENVATIALTGVKDSKIIRYAACIMIALGLSPLFASFIYSIPTAIIGAVSFLMYGMISASGLRNITENHVDFTKTRNLIICATIIISGVGFTAYPIVFTIGNINFSFSGLAIAVIVGIVLNLLLGEEKNDNV